MNGDLLVLLFVSIVLITAYGVIGIISNYHLKKRLIDSGKFDDESLSLLSRSFLDIKLSTIKWATLLFFGSLGLLIFPFLPEWLTASTFMYGVEAMLLALGLTVYYLLVKRIKGI